MKQVHIREGDAIVINGKKLIMKNGELLEYQHLPPDGFLKAHLKFEKDGWEYDIKMRMPVKDCVADKNPTLEELHKSIILDYTYVNEWFDDWCLFTMVDLCNIEKFELTLDNER